MRGLQFSNSTIILFQHDMGHGAGAIGLSVGTHVSELEGCVDGECCSPHRVGQRLSLVLMHPQVLSQRDKTNQTKGDVKREIIYKKCQQSGNQGYF